MVIFVVHNIRHVKMQLNDVIKSIGWYQAFVLLPIQTDTSIGIGASQFCFAPSLCHMIISVPQ